MVTETHKLLFKQETWYPQRRNTLNSSRFSKTANSLVMLKVSKFFIAASTNFPLDTTPHLTLQLKVQSHSYSHNSYEKFIIIESQNQNDTTIQKILRVFYVLYLGKNPKSLYYSMRKIRKLSQSEHIFAIIKSLSS